MDWTFWIVLAWALLASVALFACTTKLIPLPFPDRGFRIFTCPSGKSANLLMDVLQIGGLARGWRMNSENVQRMIMKDRTTIINTATPELLAAMGNPQASIAIPVDNPKKCAERAVRFLHKCNCKARMAPLLEVPGKDEAMYYVATDAFPQIVIFRWHMIRMISSQAR